MNLGLSIVFSGRTLVFIYAATVSALLVIHIWRSGPHAAPRSERWIVVPFLLSSLAFVLLGRLPILRYDLAINPDEAMMAANAMRTRYGWLNWDIIDSVTSGPLNSAVLAWPYLLGGDITLFSTRLTGLACLFGTLVLLFLSIRRMSDARTAIIATAPGVLFVGGATLNDFVHYSSEQLPVFLLALALYLFALSFDRSRLACLLGSAAVLGLIPFAKLQATPLATVIGAFVVMRTVFTSHSVVSAAGRVALVVGVALIGPLIYLVPLALSHGLEDAFKSYILQPRYRMGAWADHIPSMIASAAIFQALLIACGIMIAASAFYIVRNGMRGPAGGHSASAPLRWNGALALILLPTAYASISFPGRSFHHYLLLAFPVLILLGGVSIAALRRFRFTQTWQRTGWQAGIFVASLAIMVPAVLGEQIWIKLYFERGGGALFEGFPLQAPHNLAWLRPTAEDSMLCWGWGPECYVNAAIRPATRETTNENQHYDLPLIQYFRSRFIDDFNVASPDFVVDIVAPGSFPLGSEAEGIETFPALADIIARDFDLVSRVEPPGRCPRLYVRRTRLAELNKSRIEFSSRDASASMSGHEASALDDGSVYETCDDNWLLPPGTLGSVTLRFERAESVRTIAILNTRRGDKGQRAGSDKIRVSVMSGERIVQHDDISLRPFPYWTFHRLDNPAHGNALTIDVLSIRGTSGGLNEVKVYRD